ncbi:hypothetical protein INS49_011657 [Diaporthe citri]|uniref:uncharacterized protein n=1 Tax=Diaporthe citri TaxID=83186 RepID=UPI001C809C64|nr:uncharacterized protein INS49_011657 [Diaporthe citri]KAG6360595.1 hypothetical protein INS49_011657 [Diaporthe citri]
MGLSSALQNPRAVPRQTYCVNIYGREGRRVGEELHEYRASRSRREHVGMSGTYEMC